MVRLWVQGGGRGATWVSLLPLWGHRVDVRLFNPQRSGSGGDES